MFTGSVPSAVFIADGVAVALVRPGGHRVVAEPQTPVTGRLTRSLNLRPSRLAALRPATTSTAPTAS